MPFWYLIHLEEICCVFIWAGNALKEEDWHPSVPQGYCFGTSVIWQICFWGKANRPLLPSFLTSWQIKDLDSKNTENATYQVYQLEKDVKKQKYTCVLDTYVYGKVFMEYRASLKRNTFLLEILIYHFEKWERKTVKIVLLHYFHWHSWGNVYYVQFNWKLTWNKLIWVSSLQMSTHAHNYFRSTWEFQSVYIHFSETG